MTGRYPLSPAGNLRLAALCLLLAGLAACGGGNGGGKGIRSLGSIFQQAFAQGPNDTPLDISNAGLRVQLKRDPFEL